MQNKAQYHWLLLQIKENFMKHIWTILCKKSVTDNETNMISLFDSFEQLNVDLKVKKEDLDKPINIPIEHEIVSYWIKDTNDSISKFFINIEILDPNSKIIGTFKQEVNFPENLKRIRTRIKSAGLPLTTSGNYFFKVEYKFENEEKYKKVIEIPLEVIINKNIIPQTQGIS